MKKCEGRNDLEFQTQLDDTVVLCMNRHFCILLSCGLISVCVCLQNCVHSPSSLSISESQVDISAYSYI